MAPAMAAAVATSASTSRPAAGRIWIVRSEEHTSELQSQSNLVCRLLLEKKKKDQSVFMRKPVSQFDSVMYIGSREENASKQTLEPRSDSIGTAKTFAPFRQSSDTIHICC